MRNAQSSSNKSFQRTPSASRSGPLNSGDVVTLRATTSARAERYPLQRHDGAAEELRRIEKQLGPKRCLLAESRERHQVAGAKPGERD